MEDDETYWQRIALRFSQRCSVWTRNPNWGRYGEGVSKKIMKVLDGDLDRYLEVDKTLLKPTDEYFKLSLS